MYPRLRSLKFVFEVVFVIFLISFLTLAFPFLEAWEGVSGEIVLPFTFVYPRTIYSRNPAKMLQCGGLRPLTLDLVT